MKYKHFYMLQRLSAIYVLIYIFYLIFNLYQINYTDFLHFFNQTHNRVSFLIFYLSLLGHTYIGMQIIIDDYLKKYLKLWITYITNFSLIICILLVMDFLWR
jgi:succinate dehydrogenase hydrophobic membrane anchor protein